MGKKRSNIIMNSKVLFITCFIIIWMLAANCASFFGFPSYYDATTYKNLTDLKPRVLLLYDTFTTDLPDTSEIREIRLKLDQMIEYEKGKGPPNKETTKQIELIKGMFEHHVEDRLNGDKWSKIHLENNKENIAEAFYIAISTENLKNKNQ
jgi:hypothetical protein